MELALITPVTAIDPVCGMSVDPQHAKGSHAHNGTLYHFCSPSCLKKFQASPAQYIAGKRESMTEATSVPTAGTRYICPMDPEVVSDRPGACPRCGMALEPAVPTTDEKPDAEEAEMSRRFWVGLVLGLPLFVLAMLDMLPSQPVTTWLGMAAFLQLQWLLATPIVFWCARPFFQRAWVSFRLRSANMFTLIALGVGAAYIYSAAATLAYLTGADLLPAGFAAHGGMVEPYFESAAAIVVLVLAGQMLELRARRRTGAAVRSLLQLAPSTARLILPDNREEDVAVERIQPGDRVRIRPGERVAIDGIVRDGSTHIDESMLTGEAIPVAKGPGDTVSAGTLNGHGAVVVETQKAGGATLLARIVLLVAEAQRSRMPVQALVDRVAARFVPAVLLASLLTFLGWSIFGASGQRFALGLFNAMAVLIIACPCALGLATPMAVVVGMGRGAALGVLFRNADMLERLRQVDTLVFDKTGTLTAGKPEVTHVEPSGQQLEDELLRLTASLERASEHPLAKAIVHSAEAKGLSLANATEVTILPGQGIRGTVEGQVIAIGNAGLLSQEQVEGEASRRRLEDLREDGHTVVQIAIAGHYAGLIAISDPVRLSTPAAIEALKAEGLKLVMLTGDSRTTANAVARRLGITEIISDVLPTEKHERIRQMQAAGGKVAMVGDGINDAAALAQADVGIAMGGGADAAIESAGITLIRPDLRALIAARTLSRAAMRTIRQNLLLAFLYNALAIPLAAGILVPFGGPLIGPIWAAAAMSLSSLSVVGNSLRLRNVAG